MIYEIEQYELHCVAYRVEANTREEAITEVLNGSAEMVDDSSEYIEPAEMYGSPPTIRRIVGLNNDR